MGLFDDLSRFLETRLDEFLREHPHLELEAIEEQLREQEEDTQRLIAELQQQQKQQREGIVVIAQQIQRWHERIEKAKAAQRWDLVQAAQDKEASLLRLGNQRWGQMEGVNKRLERAQRLLAQIRQRRQEVKTQSARAAAPSADSGRSSAGWQRGASEAADDPLEAQFQRWEAERELDEMKRQSRS